MNIENIISVFCRLSDADEETSVKFRFLCESAMKYVSSHIRPDADVCGSNSKLEFAAAALAYYRFVLWFSSENRQDITIGEISVRSSSQKIDYALKICEQAFGDIADIFDNGYFIFEGI